GAILDVSRATVAEAGAVDAVGITNQRATTVLWDRSTGEPLGPAVSWQDLRTVGMCLGLRAQGLRVAPNTSASKLAFLLDMADAERTRAEAGELCFGTIDTWAAWVLSGGSVHATDPSNAAVTGLLHTDGSGWDPALLEALRIPEAVLPQIVDSSGAFGAASALAGSPPLAGIAGDQQASLMGQSCTMPGQAKATFGTGGMLDVCVGSERPAFETRGEAGCYPIVAWRLDDSTTWGVEAAMLTAGSAVTWLRDDLGLISSAEESAAVAAQCEHTDDVWFVPALVGLGTPDWDFGARGTLLGLTRGTGRAEVVRAVLEGIAHRGADLLEAAQADAELEVTTLRVDGGMSANTVFVQALADAIGRPVELSPVTEATTLGAGFLAGLAVSTWSGVDQLSELWNPRDVVEPQRDTDRDRWREARSRARDQVPELSALDF
ncbi:MAG: glycerol kinase, partial [Actinobacteria bacterium]|nr:glycerol kinase [Actinomycetota bacterium]